MTFKEYEISCQRALTGKKWTIKRRYRDFFVLNDKIRFFGLDLSLPPKKMFGNLKADFIEERKAGLQVRLRILIDFNQYLKISALISDVSG